MTKTVKFGGSSLADSTQFKKVRDIIMADDDRAYVVVSAPGKRFSEDNKVTDLLMMSQQLSEHGLSFDEVFNIIKERYHSIADDLGLNVNLEKEFRTIHQGLEEGTTVDYVASRGEYLNAKLMAAYLGAEFVDAADIIRFKNSDSYDPEATEKLIQERLKGVERAVIPGFYGALEDGTIVTFSRGGSDVTGSIVSDAMDVDLYENWTDVPGFLQVNPQIVPEAKPMEKVSYSELRELSYMGAPVLHEEAIFPVRRKRIPINIRDTNDTSAPGTMIVADDEEFGSQNIISGIAGHKNFTVINVAKTLMNLEKGFLRKIISVFESNNVNIEHIPSSIDSISVIVADDEIRGKIDKIKEEIKIYTGPDDVKVEDGLALLTVVGRGMVSKKGVSARIFTALYEADINVVMITQGASEISIIVGIDNDDFEKASEAIYRAFEGLED